MGARPVDAPVDLNFKLDDKGSVSLIQRDIVVWLVNFYLTILKVDFTTGAGLISHFPNKPRKSH